MGTKYTVSDAGIVTLTNDLIIDTNVLKVDTSGNFVGINKTTPAVALDVVGAVTSTGTVTGNLFSGSGASLTSIPETAITDGALLARVAAAETISGAWSFTSAGTAITLTNNASFGTMGIGTTTPVASALLELVSTTKGILTPRMNMAARDAISSPATGLLIYQTDNTPGYYYYPSGGPWSAIAGSSGHTIQEEGSSLTARTNLNFVGAAVTATDGGAGPNSTIVTISGQTDKRESYVTGTASGNYTGSLTVFDLVDTYSVGGKDLSVYVNGVLQRVTSNYTETDNNTVTFLTALVSGVDNVDFIWTTGTVSATDADTVDTFHASSTPTANNLLPLDANALMPAAALPVSTLKWTKYTVAYTALSTAATTNNITLFTLPAGGIIHGVKIKHSTSFTGGAISAYTLSVGITGTLAKYATAYDVFQATASNTFQLSNILGSEDHTSTTAIKVAATSTGANLNAATAGSADIWVLTSQAV